METGSLTVKTEDLDLGHTLTPGQSFRWREDEQGRWVGVVGKRVVRVWREGESILYRMFPGPPDEAFIRDYFRLDVDLQGLYRDFLEADGRLAGAIERFRGLRVLRQDPAETLLSYICSAANSVPRISASVELMSREYGEYIATVDERDYYSFPSVEVLASTSPECVANICSLGFRCANLTFVARQVMDRSVEWLYSLRGASYEQARAELLEIRGVGLKIADCALLFSLDKDQAFPVDTHIRQVAAKYYLPEFKQKTLTPAVYRQIVDFFQRKYGHYAGWAQEYLFYDDLLRHKPADRLH